MASLWLLSIARVLCLGAAVLFAATITANAAICRVSEVGSSTITCGEKFSVKATEEPDKAALAKIKPGTFIQQPTANMAAADIKVAKAESGGWRILTAVLVGLLTALLFALLIAGGATPPTGSRCRLLVLVVGQDNRYSNSKIQAAAWMGLLLIAYMATCILRWWSGMPWADATSVGISENLLTVAGMSAAAAAGAKITSTKASEAPAGPAKTAAGTPSFWRDLFQNDTGKWDIGDAQMIVVTAASIVFFLVNMYMLFVELPLAAHIDLPNPTNILTFAFGGSLGGYLAKKIGGTVGSS